MHNNILRWVDGCITHSLIAVRNGYPGGQEGQQGQLTPHFLDLGSRIEAWPIFGPPLLRHWPPFMNCSAAVWLWLRYQLCDEACQSRWQVILTARFGWSNRWVIKMRSTFQGINVIWVECPPICIRGRRAGSTTKNWYKSALSGATAQIWVHDTSTCRNRVLFIVALVNSGCVFFWCMEQFETTLWF